MMRTKLITALGAMAMVSVSGAPRMLGAQAGFEGVITMHMSAQGMDQDLTFSSKGDNVRVDMSMNGGMQVFMLYTVSKKMMDLVLPAQMMYMERSTDNAGAAGAAVTGKAPEIAWTGKKETIAGYECEHATFTETNGTQSDACLAKGLGSFISLSGGGMMGGGRRGGASQGGGWQSLVPQGVFPLKIVTGGNTAMEVTKIDKKSLDGALFTVPDGYQKMAMPGGGGR